MQISRSIFLATVLVLASSALAQTVLIKKSTEIFHGVNLNISSPDGRSVIRCTTPEDDSKDPQLFAVHGKRSLYLGTLPRSGEVFWRPDSKMAALNDDMGSDHSEFRLVRVDPELREIKSAFETVWKRGHPEFKVGEILHDYTRVAGWLNGSDALITVYANGMPPGRRYGAAIAFCRGYVLDTESMKITREVSAGELRSKFGVELCGR